MVHVFGNATAATGIPESEYARHFDTVSVCFSKALGAPVGSALAGSREFIARARRFKQQIGGGFRQADYRGRRALCAAEQPGAADRRSRTCTSFGGRHRFTAGY